MGEHLVSKLNALADTVNIIEEVRGEGLLVGIELKNDKKFNSDPSELAGALARRCFENGLILLSFGNVIEMTPALIINEHQIDLAVNIFAKSIRELTLEL
jgi:4-aminobutyrate aminotransferase-like enzyme